MGKVASLAVHGAIAGGLAAACMTVFRMVAHRAGWSSATAQQQAVDIWEGEPLDLGATATEARLAHQLSSVAYGAAWGAVHATLLGRHGPANAARAVELGLPLWVLGSRGLFRTPELGRPAWRSNPSELVVSLSAHLLYGAVTAFVTEELNKPSATSSELAARAE